MVRIYEINGYAVDLRRVQCISPVEKGSYSITLVSGWEIKAVPNDTQPRDELVKAWKDYLESC